MIRYALRCKDGHVFDSWFQSAAAYDALAAAGRLSCAECGTPEVDKTLMAPRVAPEGSERKEADKRAALAKLREEIERKATYVGGGFARKAREMYEGITPDAPIYGEASAEEARALIEDGVPVLPLPFKPRQKLQ